MGSKTLSISIAAYNVSHCIRKTLDSLIIDARHMEKLDVIVVNDGSTDDTLSIVNEYVKRYPDVFRVINKKNGGYGSTINASLAVAYGRYYKLLDGDDWYDKDGLCSLIDFLDELDGLEGTNADLVISPYYQVKGTAILVPHHEEIPNKPCALRSLSVFADELFQMHGITVKTHVLKNYGHPIARHCFYTDIEYLFYCFCSAESVVRHNAPVYCYRLDVNGQSVSLKGIQKHFKDHSKVTMRICRCYEEECLGFSGAKRKILDSAVTYSIYGMFKSYMVLNNAGQYKKELMQLDAYLHSHYPEAYQTGYESKAVKAVRMLRFRFYNVLCAYMKWRAVRS